MFITLQLLMIYNNTMRIFKTIIIGLALLVTYTTATAQKTKSKKASGKITKVVTETISDAPLAAAEAKEIKWLNFAEAQRLMAITPKKVYVDIFTDWCGWCKVMDKKTFQNPDVVKYMNANFYCIKFNAEKDNAIYFMGKMYELENGVSALANKLMNGKLSYPTSIFMEEGFNNPQPVPGYLDLVNYETIVTYLASGNSKTTPFDKYKETFKPVWK
jgi:thioredoxin-related protein